MEFKKGDEVKFSYQGSIIMHYGKIERVNKKTCTVVMNNNGAKEKICVAKEILNFD